MKTKIVIISVGISGQRPKHRFLYSIITHPIACILSQS